MRRQAPFRYYGGKQHLVKWLLQFVPPHRIYVEVFGGAAALLFSKPPAEIEVYNDIDSNVVNFFRVLRDEQKARRLQELLRLTPFSREEFYFCRDHINDPDVDDVERARRFFVVAQQSFSGHGRTWQISRVENKAKRYFNAVDDLMKFAHRFRNVVVENVDFEYVIKFYDTAETFFYCDPPYLHVKADVLGQKMTVDDHKRLVDVLLNVKGKVMLSGYKNEIYRRLEKAGWHRIDFTKYLYYSNSQDSEGKRRKVVESIWVNYNLQKISQKKKNE